MVCQCLYFYSLIVIVATFSILKIYYLDRHALEVYGLCDVGTVISGYQVNESWHLIAKGNPQWPQVRQY